MRIAAFLGMFLIAASSAQAWNGTGHIASVVIAQWEGEFKPEAQSFSKILQA